MDAPDLQAMFEADNADEFRDILAEIQRQKYELVPRLWELAGDCPELLPANGLSRANLIEAAQAYAAWAINRAIERDYAPAHACWVFVKQPKYGLSWTDLRIDRMVMEDFVGKYLRAIYDQLNIKPTGALKLIELIYAYPMAQNYFLDTDDKVIVTCAIGVLEATYHRLRGAHDRLQVAVRRAVTLVRFLEAQQKRETTPVDFEVMKLLPELSFSVEDARKLRDTLIRQAV